MQKDEMLKAIETIGTSEDEVERRTLLAEMRDDISAIFDSNSELTELNTKLQNDNESLRSANMKLFLRVGEHKSPEQQQKDSTGIDSHPTPKRNFDDLFNEKGGIK